MEKIAFGIGVGSGAKSSATDVNSNRERVSHRTCHSSLSVAAIKLQQGKKRERDG